MLDCKYLIFFLLLLFAFKGVAQDDYDGPPCVICDLDCIECGSWTQIVSYTDTLLAVQGANDNPSVMCTNVENMTTWYGFIAGTENLEFTVTNDSCFGGLSQNLEVGVFEGVGCTNFTQVSDICYGTAMGGGISLDVGDTEVLVMSNLEVGQYYWIIIESTSDLTNCWFTLDVTDGTTGSMLAANPEIGGPLVLCDNQSETYSILNDAGTFEWFVDGNSEYLGEDFEFVPPGLGTFEICAQKDNYCGTGLLSNPCFIVTSSESSDGEQALAICDGDCINYASNTYCIASQEDVFLTNTAGCDSVVALTVHNLLFEPVITAGNACINGSGIDIILTPLDLSNPALDGSQTATWDWYYNGSLIAGQTDMLIIYASSSGNYTIDYTVTYLGVSCTYTYGIAIDASNYAYQFDPLIMYETACSNNIAEYSLDYAPFMEDDFEVTWTVPSDAMIISGQGTETIEVQWNDTGGDVCYIVSNSCAESTEVCFPIDLINSTAQPSIQASQLEACLDEEITFESLGIPASYDLFEWNISTGGTIVAGMASDPSDIVVSWSELGTQSVELLLDDGCDSLIANLEIQIIDNPPFPTMECIINGDELTIDWEDIPGVTNYSLGPMSTGPAGVIDGSSYIISGLNPGEAVDIEIIGEGPCGDFSSSLLMCEMNDCPITDLVFVTDLPDTLCINSSQQQFNLMGVDNEGNQGLESYEGSGVTDSATGLFNITAAGAGQHIISYVLSLNNAECISRAYDTIVVLEEPTLSLAEIQPICIGDTIQVFIDGLTNALAVTGTFGSATFVNEDSMGYYSLSYDNAGSEIVNFAITDPYCGDYLLDTEIIIEDTPQLNIVCLEQATNSITIGWDVSGNYASYDIFIDGIFSDNITGSQYSIQNLPIDTTLNFTVSAVLLNGACPPDEQSIQCMTVDCVNVPSMIISPVDTFLCGNDLFQEIVLTLEYDQSLLDGTEIIQWSGNGISSDGVFDPNVGYGEFVLSAAIYHEDCEYNSQITFVVESIPVLSLEGTSEVCIEDTWELNYTGDIDSDYTYLWLTNSSENLNGLGPHEIDFDTPGDYFFTIQASKDDCLADPFTFNVTVQDSVTTAQIGCLPGSDNLSIEWLVEDSDCNSFYEIYLNGLLIETNYAQTSYIFSNLDLETEYEIEVVTNSSCLCPSKSSKISCTTIPCPAQNLTVVSDALLYCLDVPQESATLRAMLNGSVVTDNLFWEGPGIDQNGVINFDQLSEGSFLYTVVYTLQDCSYPAQIEIVFYTPVNYDYSLTAPICPEDSLGSIIIEGPMDPSISYFINQQEVNPAEEVSLLIGSHELSVISNSVCIQTDYFSIQSAPAPSFTISGPEFISFGQSGDFEILSDPMVNISDFLWTYNDSLIANMENFEFNEPGSLCAEISYIEDCQYEICRLVELENPNVYIPNVISLSSGSANNFFTLFSNDRNAQVDYLMIYDRWGNLIFSKENKMITDPELQWNGIFKNKFVDSGVYVFTANINFSSGSVEKYTGHISVVR